MNYPVSTSIHLTFDPFFRTDITEQIKRITDAGFRYLDFNFIDLHAKWESPFMGKAWEALGDRAGETATKAGAIFNQAHAPVYNGLMAPGMTEEDVFECYRRAIIICSRLGIPWMVYHAKSFRDDSWLDKNREYFMPVLELSNRYGVGMAIENTWIENTYDPLSKTENLIALVDSFADPLVGICWDTGHGNVYGGIEELKPLTDEYAQIMKLGKRLKALHIDDNFGLIDDHLAPFEGTIDWKRVMLALRDVEYEHSFTFEAHNSVRRIPVECVDLVNEKMHYLHDLGETLVHLID